MFGGEIMAGEVESLMGGALGGGMLALIAGMFIFVLLMVAVVYVYMALVWSTIAKKLGYDKPWLAWIPVVQAVLLPILAKENFAKV
jgi:hypothetical protein